MKNYPFGILALAAITLFGCDRNLDKPNDPNRPRANDYTADTFPSEYRTDDHRSGSDPTTDYRSGVNTSDRRSDNVLPDNTGVNVRDRNPGAVLPENQMESPADREITKLIRQAIVADDTLSFYGKNVKIITRNGEVTLRGVVEIQAERDSIAHKAGAVRGVNKVNNLIEAKKS